MVGIEIILMKFDGSTEGHDVRAVLAPRFDDPMGDLRVTIHVMGQPSDRWLGQFTERLAGLHQTWGIAPTSATGVRYAYDFDQQDSDLAKWFSQYVLGVSERQFADQVYEAIERRRARLAALRAL